MCLAHPISAIYHKSIIFRFLSVINSNVLSSHLLLWWNNRPWFLPQTGDSLRSPDVSEFSVTKGEFAVLSALCRACECRGLITRGQIRPAETKRFSDVRDESVKSPDFFVFKLLYVSAPPVVSNYMDARQGGRLLHLSLRCEVPYSFCYILFPFFKIVVAELENVLNTASNFSPQPQFYAASQFFFLHNGTPLTHFLTTA